MANYTEEEQRVLTKEMSDKIYNDSYSTTEEELQKDTNWIEASKGVYKQLEGVEWSGSDEDAAKKGLEMMGRFNYNLTLGTINYTAQLQDADPKTKLDFYYMMDMYDKKDISGAGVGRAFKEMGLDPASYIGIGTLGAGFVGKQAATVAAKTGLKTMLKQGAMKFLQSPAAVAATEGAIYTGVDDVARQDAAIGAGLQDEYSPTQTAVASGIGAVAGAGIVKGGQALGRGITKAVNAEEDMLRKNFEVGGSMAGGGTPPQADNKKTIYHGTDKIFDEFDVKKSADGTIWFTDNKKKIEDGEVAAAGKGQIMERSIDENNLKLGGWDEEDKYSTNELMDMGYDGLKLEDGDETTYQIFYPEKLDKKSMAGGGTPPTIDNIPSSAYSEAKASPEKSYNPLKKTVPLDEDSVIVGTQKEDKNIYVGRDKNGNYFTINRKDAFNISNTYAEKLKKLKKTETPDAVSKFQEDVKVQTQKHGDIEDLDYSMMDISDRDLTRVQRVKNTVDEIQDDPENAVYTASTFSEFQETYPDQFRQAKIKPETKEGKVKIYRSATGDIEPGDWIGLDKSYAASHGRTKEHKTYEMWVDAEDIRWQGADANEWIYLPNDIIEADIDYKGSK